MSTPDYTAQAAKYAEDATVTPQPGDWFAPGGSLSAGWSVHSEEMNMGIDMEAVDEAAARVKAAEHFAGELRSRDPSYVAPVQPSTADLVLAALSSLDPKVATAADAISAVTTALVDAGATTATVTTV